MEYVREIVTPLIRDERVLMWDLCNEPQLQQISDPVAGPELAWLARVADTVRQTGVQ